MGSQRRVLRGQTRSTADDQLSSMSELQVGVLHALEKGKGWDADPTRSFQRSVFRFKTVFEIAHVDAFALTRFPACTWCQTSVASFVLSTSEFAPRD